MKLFKYILSPHLPITLLVFTLITSSCDPGVGYSKVIQNDSEFELKISIHGDSDEFYKDSVFYISRGTEQVIFDFSGLGQTFKFEDCDLYADSLSLKITNDTETKPQIDINDKSNWLFKILDESFKQGGVCECRLIINNENFK